MGQMEDWGSKLRDPGAIDSTVLYSISERFHPANAELSSG